MYCCPYCHKFVKSWGGLRQHIDRTPACLEEERELLGAKPACTLGKKPPPDASFPTKRTTELAFFGPGFDLSEADSALRHAESKRPRLYFDAGLEKMCRPHVFATKGKLPTALGGMKWHALLDKCSLETAFPKEQGEMAATEEDEEDTPLGLEESSSEDELEIVGGPDADIESNDYDVENEVPLPPLNGPGVPPPSSRGECSRLQQ